MVDKHVFWQALIIVIFIFSLGILAGYFLELNRTSKIIEAYQEAEINLLDVQLQREIFNSRYFNCETAIRELMEFADKTYNEALILEKYKESSRLSKGILFQYEKYSLLRTILWINSINIKQECVEFDTIVYFYEFNTNNLDTLAKQKAFSNFLAELKRKYGNKIILIPIAGNLEVNSIDILLEKHSIENLPTILVNEEHKFENTDSLSLIENYLNFK